MASPPRRRTALSVEQLETRDTPTFGLTGGESIAIGDVFPEVNGSIRNEIVVGAGPGSPPYVRVYSTDGVLEAEFLAYEQSFLGGVNVALADVAQDPAQNLPPNNTPRRITEIVTGTGIGGGPVVKVFNPNQNGAASPVATFLAYESTFRGGVNVAAFDPDGDIRPNPLAGQAGQPAFLGTQPDEIVTGSGPGGGPVVKLFTATGGQVKSFFAYESTFRFGVNVTAGNLNRGLSLSSPGDEIATGPGVGGSPLLKVWDVTGTPTVTRSVFAFDLNSRNGLTVAAGHTPGRVRFNDGLGTDDNLAEEVFAAEAFTPLTQAPRIRSFNVEDAPQIESDFSPFPAGYTQYINLALGDVAIQGQPLGTADGIEDLAVVSGEGPTSQTPRIFYGAVGSAAGNNGP